MARILLVDDVYTARSMFERVLRHVGRHEVLSVGSGAEALAKVHEFAPDVIVLDISMADRDGLMVLRDLRAQGITCPIIAHTARTEKTPGEFVAQGFDAYVPKTGNLTNLLSTVRDLVRR